MARARKAKVLAAGKRRRTRALRVEALEDRVVLSSVVPLAEFTYGLPGDVDHFMGDWDGDGIDTPGIYRDGVFHLRNSNTTGPGELSFAYGLPGDTPMVGDWDGDGIDTPGVVRAGVWHLRNSNTTGFGEISFAYGLPDDKPITGDWDGDGVDTPGVVRDYLAPWHLRNTNETGVGDVNFQFASGVGCGSGGGDNFVTGACVATWPVLAGTPVAGDWNGDGIDAVGIFRTASWYLGMLSQGAVINKVQFQFGLGNSIPLTGHFGDGKHDLVGVVDVNVWRFSDPASRASAFSNPLAILPPADRLPESIHFRLRQTYAEYLEFLASNAESGDSFEPSEGLVQVRSDGFVAVEIHSSIPGFRQRLDDIINGGDPDAQAKLDQENTEFDAFSEALRALGVEATSTQEEFGTRSVSGWLPLSSVPQLPELPHFAAAEASLRALLGSETPTSATSRPNFQTA